MSKYQAIYEDLRSQIINQKIEPKTYLPSESELMEQYQASRDTIRKSLNLLAQQGYIQKEKGKGSLVLEQDTISFPVSGLTSFKELKESGLGPDTKTEVVLFQVEKPSDKIAKKMNISNGLVDEIKRVRIIDNERIIYDHDYINAAIIPGLTEKEAENSIYEYIEKDLGLTISFARKEITVVPATSEDRKLLDLKDYDFLVCVKSYNFLEDASLFAYTVSKHRPDKFRFVDFSRREAR